MIIKSFTTPIGRLNYNKYNTWDSETIKPVANSKITKQYYLYYKVVEELKEQQINKAKLISYIDDTYEIKCFFSYLKLFNK